MSSTLQALLDAHVRFELARLRGASLNQLIDLHGEAIVGWLSETELSKLVTREQIMGVIDRYVIELAVGGGITELAGEMSRAILSSPAMADTSVQQIISPETFREFADKVESLTDAGRGLVELICNSPSLAVLVSRVVSSIVMEMLFAPSTDGPIARLRAPLLADLEARFGPLLSRFIEERTDRAIEAHRAQLVDTIGIDGIRAVADDLFDALAKRRLADSGRVFTAQDLEDFVVLGYEFWLKFRRSEFFREVVAEVVDKLFDKYGDESLVGVMMDLGVDPSLIVDELKLFAGPVLLLAEQSGFLELRIRALLSPFYTSPEALAVLS